MPDIRDILKFITGGGDPRLPGPLNALPRPIRAGLGVVGPVAGPLGALAGPGGQVGQAIAGQVAANPVGNAISGEGLYAIARIVQAARAASGPDTPSTPMSELADRVVAQGAGHPIRIQQLVEHSPNPLVSKAAGAEAMVFDPTNYLAAGAELAQATKFDRAAQLLQAVDRAQSLPIEGLGIVAKKASGPLREAAAQRLAATFVADSAKATGKAGGPPLREIGKVGGVRQLGAPPPPEFVVPRPGMVEGLQPAPPPGQIGLFDPAPSQLPLPSAPPARQPVRPPASLLPPEAVTPAEEAAAKAATYGPLDHPVGIPQTAPPDLPGYAGQTRRAALATLEPDEIDNLLSVAYGHENGVANALLKRRDPVDLADRAIERITTSRTKAGLLQQAYPDLAEKIAFLPEPEAALAGEPVQLAQHLAGARPPSINAQGYSIDEIIARHTPAPPLSNVDIPASITDPAERAAWQARYAGQSQAGTDILAAGDKVAGSDVTQADLNAMSPQERMAALRKLAAEPAATPAVPVTGSNDQRVIGMAALKGGTPTLAEIQAEFKVGASEALRLQDVAAGRVAPKATGGGDLAAGGGGFGLLPFRGGLGAANRATSGAAGGALVGGAAGAATSPDDRLAGAAKGAAAGALLGGNLGAGAGLLESRLAQGATAGAGRPLLAHAWEQAGVEQRAANAASGNLLSAIKNLPAVWRRNVTEHPKNLLGDEAWGRTVLQGAQGGGSQALLRQVRDEAARRLEGATPWERLPDTTRAAMAALGRDGQVPDLGSSFHNAESNLTRKVISTSDQMIGSGILSLANPAAVAQNLVGAGGSVALGAVRPGWHGFFQAVNGFQQETFRQAAFADEAATGLKLAADRFLPDLQAAGVDISRLAPDGSFSVKDVHDLAGQAAADRWKAYGDAIYDSATKRVKFLFGDFSKRGAVEKALGGPIPFTSWMVRAYPVALSLLAQHPAVALAVYQYMRLTSAGAGKDGRPGYTAGMIPIDQNTFLLGGLAKLYTQGEGGKAYLDPLGGISPVGGDMFQPAEDDSQKNWYQRGTDLLSRLGLPGVNPAIQAGAYVAGLDYKSPSALSRTQGLENAAALIPGNPQLPDVAGGLLRAARGSVSQAAQAAGVPGAKADKTPTAYDPITRRYAELWYAKTGKPLNDKSDPSGLIAMGDPDNPLMQQARREVLLGGAVKNVGSLTSPVGVIGQSGENADYRAAQAGTPFSAARIAGSSPGVQQLMQVGNRQYQQATPASQTYKVANREQAAYALLDQFDADPLNLWIKQVAPQSYRAKREALMVSLGLAAPPKAPYPNPYLTPGR